MSYGEEKECRALLSCILFVWNKSAKKNHPIKGEGIMVTKSVWIDTVKSINYPPLKKDISVDILIIGGGITGVSCLYHLKNSKYKVALVEQNKIGHATTGNSTGKLSYLQDSLIDKIRKSASEEKASFYLKFQRDAIEYIVNQITKESLSCDLEKVNSKVYTNQESEVELLKELKNFLERNGVLVKETTSSFVKSKYMIETEDTYVFHPLKFLQELLKKNTFPVYENTSIQKIRKQNSTYLCYTKEHCIKAKKVILASHYPYFFIPFFFPSKASLEKSYLAASNPQKEKTSLISYSNPYISIRSDSKQFLYLTSTQDIEKKTSSSKQLLKLKKSLKDLKITPTHIWSNLDVKSVDGLPYIGRLKEEIYLSTGYNTWGLATGFYAGKMIKDLLENKDNIYLKLTNPNRSIKMFSKIENVIKSMKGFINGWTSIEEETRICPHMGCKLIFNRIEGIYECPCHGSKFNDEGKCINGPSKKDIQIKSD